MNCSRKECFREAKWKLRVMLWAPHQVHDPAAALKIETSLALCDEHKERPGTVKDFFLKQFRKGIVKQLRAAGKPAPDFDHGEWWFTPIEPQDPVVPNPNHWPRDADGREVEG